MSTSPARRRRRWPRRTSSSCGHRGTCPAGPARNRRSLVTTNSALSSKLPRFRSGEGGAVATLADCIRVLRPAAVSGTDYRVEAGVAGDVVAYWNPSAGTQPTPAELAAVTDQQV